MTSTHVKRARDLQAKLRSTEESVRHGLPRRRLDRRAAA
jgi:hypothetical protein